jgi:tetratricopeptide (TPR) repeat protein
MKRNLREHVLKSLVFALLLSFAACNKGEGADTALQAEKDASSAATSSPTPAASSAPVVEDASKLDAEIERLEKQAEKNSGDDETRVGLARAYVRRANSLRDAQRMREALFDYQRALRIDPDNEEAQKNSAEIAPIVEGTPQEGEYGDPPPLPITPNVTGGEEKASPTPTPKRP